MRILHVCLSNFYIEHYTYQENMLSIQNKKDGHDVMILASTETYDDNISIGYIQPIEYINDYGIKVKRIPYVNLFNSFLEKKVRAYKGVYKIVEDFSPDVILFHGISAYELITIAKYKKKYSKTKFYIDNHADFGNTGRKWLSMNILHKIFYKSIVRFCLPYVDKFLYISLDCGKFLKEVYSIPEDRMEFYSLGGFITDEETKAYTRNEIRAELGLTEQDIVFVQSGKIGRDKRLQDTLWAFKQVTDERFKLLIIGSLTDEIKAIVEEYIKNDKRIIYLGWKSGAELQRYLLACDVYLQPGTVSAIAQNAICCGCAVMLKNHYIYGIFIDGNGWLIDDNNSILKVFGEISANSMILKDMEKKSIVIAEKYLDYRMLAKRLYVDL